MFDDSAGMVTFKFKDYRRSGKRLEMILSCEEFIRRFMLHVVPPGFMRIRHFVSAPENSLLKTPEKDFR